jgi:radical SAM superfamily enzyme YgiQ (UPF0313 family)
MARKTVVLLYGMLEVYDSPIGLHCLQAYCSRDPTLSSSVDFQVVTYGLNESPNDVASRILDLRPWALGLSCYVWNTDTALAVCERVKRALSSVLVVAGGPEAGHVPAEICDECRSVDVVVTGEGEETFRELLLAHLAGRTLAGVAGTSFRSGDRVISNPRRMPIDLASTPMLFDTAQQGYLSSLKEKVVYETLRGCPHVCFFCDWGVLTPGRVRSLPIERIERELSYILGNHRFSHLYLADSEINVDDDHCKQLLRTVVRLKKEFSWNGAVTFHLEISKPIDDEMADLLCEATDGIGIGVQSLEPDALYQMGRKWFNVEMFQRNVQRLEKDIHFVFQFIYGCPGDTYETFINSLGWAVDNDRDVWFDRLQVLPGSIYRNKHARFGLEFERKRPFYVTSSNTFSKADIVRAESLKRGFLLYNFRRFIHFDALCGFVGLAPMALLEAFGEWCSVHEPDRSLQFTRMDPRGLPEGFFAELGGWIGAFIQSQRPVSTAEYVQLKYRLASSNRPESAVPELGLRHPRGN